MWNSTSGWCFLSVISKGFLFWTCWAEVLSFCYSLRLDSGGGGRAGGGRALRWWFTFWDKQEARPRSCPPARFVSYVARQPEGGCVSYVTETFLHVKLLNGHNSNIKFQPYVRPIRSSTGSHQRVTKGKSPLGVGYFSTVLSTWRVRTTRQTPFINLSIECRIA